MKSPHSQLPTADQLYLDHVGFFVPDIAAASAALTRLGFAPTPLSVQVNPDPAGGAPKPTGTGNVCAMLSAGYLEVLFKTADTPLGRQLDAGLARYPGLHLAAFATADASAQHARLAGEGFRMQPLVDMCRPVGTASGEGVAAFSVVRVEPDEFPEGRIQMLRHLTEDTVWQPRWLDHPNGAIGLAGLAIVVADPDEAAGRFVRFLGRPAAPITGGWRIGLDRGVVDLITADALRERRPGLEFPSLPFMAICTVRVRTLTTLAASLTAGAVAFTRHAREIEVPFSDALGHGSWSFVETP